MAKHLDATKFGSPMSARIIAVDGSKERFIAVNGFQVEYACWSPDGSHLAIVANADGAASGTRTSRLFIVDVGGTRIREISVANVAGLRLGTIDWTGTGGVVI